MKNSSNNVQLISGQVIIEGAKGLAYANEILQDKWAPVLLFWLGFRTFTKQELLELIPALSEEELSAKLCQL